MSWTDPCLNCGDSRATCECGDWNGYNKMKQKEKEKKEEEENKKLSIFDFESTRANWEIKGFIN